MSAAQLATFHLDGYLFGVPVEQVQEVLMEQPCTPTPGAPDAVAGLINLRGQVVTALDLRRRLGLPGRDAADEAQTINVVVRCKDEAWSLLVDRIGDVMEVDDAQFEQPPDTMHGPQRELIVGAYKLDTRLLLHLDADRVLDVTGGG
ncbi:MAG TPA: chemotaxis protein CheW [Jatrophihabitans sp.]|jgi:purine-binding chemotaxis protein CheW|nr:chemotaxis protein CheW [Jatrophihabitans sp.]